MESSFSPIEEMLNAKAKHHVEYPYQEIILTRLTMHVQNKLLEYRNQLLRAQGINETLFMALVTLDANESRAIQPSELSNALGSSRTNATRIADELEKRGWIKRIECNSDRRCLNLQLTDDGDDFLTKILPEQYKCLAFLWSVLDETEREQLEVITRKLLTRLDQMSSEYSS